MNNHFSSNKISYLLISFLLISCSGQKKITKQETQKVYQYSIEKPVEGQLHTAKQLKILMESKEYEAAINLFSKEEQLNIRAIQQDDEMFKYWCLAWTMNDKSFENYKARIKEGGGIFIFEDGIWKIDEK